MAKDVGKQVDRGDAILLNDRGMLAQVSDLQSRLRDDEVLLDDVTEVFLLRDVDSITDHVAEMLLNRFVPSYLAFVLEDELVAHRPRLICFHHMRPVAAPIGVTDLEPYRQFFSQSPLAVDFKTFESGVGDARLTDPLWVFNPAKVIPLLGLDGVYGFIVVGKKVLGEPYTAREITYLDRLIKFASISLQNSMHFKRATFDQKTELYNHSFFMKRLEEELSRLKRSPSQSTLLMLDVDFFKKFNDTYGHLAGDQVLKEVARVIRETIRLEDLAARFGGEEFTVLLIQCDPDKAFQIGDRIRQTVEALRVAVGGVRLSVTVSIGVAHTTHDNPVSDSATLINHADQALYLAKRSGRNRTSVFDPEAGEDPQE